ncbi:Sec-independent protein translocase subunit TatA/TatB [Natronocalculus amylovorans]|uniref:Sec-independent protein translocase protein TatA n=1 Tax=Natronocalculus amylovorans TaxID=2917812 RepID=A0AAE3FZW9_9EURY|nr:twin-arginine translocase TatA/TatE family subunit [Natronocalculus amylovorans]MCL9818409.1 twin-arginine translocase TatA/TatE family subunit [Natronocalculus amylovorans]NUE02500.1 twin-arginine translocase TatA/TatE family subunit [Halorubraceae archaeon YAN]
MATMIPLFGGLPVGPELLIILLVLVLLFGANKIPKLARSTGQAMGEFKKGREEVEEELKEMSESKKKSSDSDTETAAADSTVEDEPVVEEAEAEADAETETAEAAEKSN